uniref:Uncharacterized protein n=1 Tax=Cucumis sativus TaxID=3659 RepID=A0A0A0K6W3_CUCSA
MHCWNTHTGIHRRPNLPNLVQRRRLLRHFHGNEDRKQIVGRLGCKVPEGKGERGGRTNGVIRSNVESTDSEGFGEESGEEGLGSSHAGGGGVDGPGDPTGGCGGRGEEGDGERGIFGIVRPVEEGVEIGEILAIGEGSVWEGLGRASEGMGDGKGRGN